MLGTTFKGRSSRTKNRVHGFRKRMEDTNGQNVIRRRRAKGRKKLSI